MISGNNHLFLLFSVATFWFQDKTFITIFTPILLATAAIMTVFYNVLAAAMTALMFY